MNSSFIQLLTLKDTLNWLKLLKTIYTYGDVGTIQSSLPDNMSKTAFEIKAITDKISLIFSSQGFLAGVKTFGTSLAAGAKALISAHPTLIALGAAVAAFKLIDTYIYDADEKLEKVAEAFSSYQETAAELESINEELETTKKNIDELNAKESLSLVEQDELEKLVRSNDELERRQKVLETLKSSKKEEARLSLSDYLDNKSTNDASFSFRDGWKLFGTGKESYSSQHIVNPDKIWNKAEGHREATVIEGIESHISAVNILQNEIDKLQAKQGKLTDEKDINKLQKQIDKKVKLQDDYKEYLSRNFEEISNNSEQFDVQYFENIDDYNKLMELLNEYDNILGISNSNINAKINGIFQIKNIKDSDVLDSLTEYIKTINNVEDFNYDNINVSGFDTLKAKLEDTGIEAKSLYQYLKAIANGDSYDLDEVKKQLQESLTGVESKNRNKDSDTFKGYVNNELIGFNSLNNPINPQVAFNPQVDINKNEVQNEISDFINSLSDKELDAVAHLKFDADIDTSQWDIETWKDQIQNYLNQNSLSITLSDISESFDKEIDSVQDAYSALKDATTEYNTYDRYSLDTIQKLLALEPKYLDLLVDENGQLSINETSLKALIQAQISDAKAKLLQAQIAEINNLQSENSKTNLENETSALDDNTQAQLDNAKANAIRKGITQEQIDNIEKKFAPLYAALDALSNNTQAALTSPKEMLS